MNLLNRTIRHARITAKNFAIGEPPSPPFLTLYLTSLCNLTCEHCFYWRNLNKNDDLTLAEIRSLSEELGQVENLNLGGGEPFLRNEFAEICRCFIRKNQVRQIYCPTSGYFTDRTTKALSEILNNEADLQLFVIELSLDGMPEYHNRFRGNPRSFEKAMETYNVLAEMQTRDSRLRIHCISTATAENLEEIRNLTLFLFEKCKAMDHHGLGLIRGDRKNPSLQRPELVSYQKLYQYIRSLWTSREHGRIGGIVEPMLQWAKVQTVKEQRQVVPCRAGVLSSVVYANGAVSVCETHPPLGNLRQQSFREIWHSPESLKLRESISKRECFCTNEIAMWPSIVFQPTQLAKIMIQAKVWKKPPEPSSEEKLTLRASETSPR